MSTKFTNLGQYAPVFGVEWWKAAGIRAGRTALLVAITYLPAAYTDAIPWLALLSAGVMAGILSLVTSLAGLAEVNNVSVPWPIAVTIRVVKTIAQALVSNVLTNVIFVQDIKWDLVLATTLSSGFGSLLLGVLKTLPETTDPIAQATLPATVVTPEGEKVQAQVPAVTNVATDSIQAATLTPTAPEVKEGENDANG